MTIYFLTFSIILFYNCNYTFLNLFYNILKFYYLNSTKKRPSCTVETNQKISTSTNRKTVNS